MRREAAGPARSGGPTARRAPAVARWTRRFAIAALLPAVLPSSRLAAQSVPTPESVLGFHVGADSMLASWRQIGDYFTRLAAASPKVRVDTLGPTTQGRPYLLVTISDPANLARRMDLMAAHRRLADPRTLDSATEEQLVRSEPAVVLISCSIHSTEIAASQMSMELAYRLATDPGLGATLRNVVVLLVPSANPDGVDIVGDWYRRTKGTPYDGSSPPWLYHPYVGHDDNRDWYMLTQPETRHLTRALYRDWFPEVVYDVHQMGSNGARLFVPPFADPVNPNLDPILVEGMSLVGSTMAEALLDAGYTGVSHQATYDLWWHGGARSTPTRHNMIGILSEAASARVASPLCLPDTALRQPAVGVNYPAAWRGGCWRLRDIVDYELVAAQALVRQASDQRAEFVRRFVRLGRRAVEAGRGAPRAYVLPALEGRDQGARALLANLLIQTGVEVYRARAPFAAGADHFAAGSLVIPMDQPFRAHAKDLLERQAYPDRRAFPGGPPIPPYDVAAWTLPLQMGVEAKAVDSALTADLERVDTVTVTPGRVTGRGEVVLLRNRSNAEVTATWRALAAGGTVQLSPFSFTADGQEWPTGTIVIRGARARAVVETAAREVGFDATLARRIEQPADAPELSRVPRVGLYRSWNASIDEGWTRWVLEQLGVPFTTVTDSVMKAGNLLRRFDVIILPSEEQDTIERGHRPGTIPAEYAGGLGNAGAQSLRSFMQEGGTLIALDQASGYAISRLGVAARVVRTSRTADSANVSRFYAPGSIFETRVDQSHPLASGLETTVPVYFISSTILEAGPGARAVLTYGQGNPLLSGYVDGPEMLGGRAALVDAPVGRGRAILFGFRPQHRGQTHATFRLLTNAILYGAANAPAPTR